MISITNDYSKKWVMSTLTLSVLILILATILYSLILNALSINLLSVFEHLRSIYAKDHGKIDMLSSFYHGEMLQC